MTSTDGSRKDVRLPANLPRMPISQKVDETPQATSIEVNQIVYDLKRAGYDPTVMSLGEAYFDLPLFDFSKIDVERGYHYSDSQGLPELRDKIAEYYETRYGAKVDGKNEILISAGSKPVIYMAMLTALDPGDEVLIHEPCWLSYPHQAKLAGAVPKFIPYDVAPSDFGQYLTDKTKMLVINNPNNPAGRLYSRDELSALYELCRTRGIYIMVDEAYSDFVIDEPFVSLADVVPDKDGIIVVNSLSKNLGMSGWRIGYAIAHPIFIANLLKVNQHLITCAPTVLLQYCTQYLDDILSITLPQVRNVVEKRRRVAAMMDELRLNRIPGGSTFYFMLSLDDFPGTAEQFVDYLLLKCFISVVPGTAYGDSTARFVRLSIGAESEERIWEALQIIRKVIDTKEFQPIDRVQVMEQLNLPRLGSA
jgi:aspartate/methionine/tyrosine aminotransferase